MTERREKVVFPDIPYEWTGGLTDEEFHTVFEHFRRERFFVGEAYDATKNHERGPGITLRTPEIKLSSAEIGDHFFLIMHVLKSAYVWKFTHKEWAHREKTT
ncbi:hypothetical protein [Desulfarculus baarsii]